MGIESDKMIVYKKNNLFGAFNSNGKTKIKPKYKKLSHFNNSIAFAFNSDDQLVMIDKNQNIVAGPYTSHDYFFDYHLEYNYNRYKLFDDRFFIAEYYLTDEANDTWRESALIHKDGTILIENCKSTCEIYEGKNGILYIFDDNYGEDSKIYISKKGKELIFYANAREVLNSKQYISNNIVYDLETKKKHFDIPNTKIVYQIGRGFIVKTKPYLRLAQGTSLSDIEQLSIVNNKGEKLTKSFDEIEETPNYFYLINHARSTEKIAVFSKNKGKIISSFKLPKLSGFYNWYQTMNDFIFAPNSDSFYMPDKIYGPYGDRIY